MVGAVVYLPKARISPDAAFSVTDWTAYVIFIVVIGGVRTVEEPIIGVLTLWGLINCLAQYGSLYLVVLGAIAVLVMLFMPDAGCKIQKDLDIAEYTDPAHNPMIPTRLFWSRGSSCSGSITATGSLDDQQMRNFDKTCVPSSQGARLIGIHDSHVAFGKSRVLLVWTRLIMPNGRSIVLERQQGGGCRWLLRFAPSRSSPVSIMSGYGTVTAPQLWRGATAFRESRRGH
jgi:hypothetical protein